MAYLDAERLAQMAGYSPAFLDRAPFPWMGLQGILTEDGFRRLTGALPDMDLFQPEIGKARGYGQQSHDRYALQYGPKVDGRLPEPWRDFIRELGARPYQNFLRRMFALSENERFVLTMHWHFAPAGASVSPHTDAARKIGSHIFYLNTGEDWDPAWGGQTVVLDDHGRLPAHSAPAFDAFGQVAEAEILGNRSFVMKRTEHSWHAVRPLTCPPGRLRRVFIVVVNRLNFQVLWRRVRGKDPDGYRL